MCCEDTAALYGKYKEVWRPYREEAQERYELVRERLCGITREETVQQPYRGYFVRAAEFLLGLCKLQEAIFEGETENYTLEQWQELNQRLYEEILPGNYEKSYADPAFAAEKLGADFGKMFCALYADMRSLIPWIFEGRIYELTIFAELLVEIYNCFEEEELPEAENIRQTIYWFYHDYGEVFMENSIRSKCCPDMDFAVSIIMESDFSDLRYLYRYGLYVTENELRTAQFLNQLSEEKIQAMADTYTEGYRIGFEVTGKDLSKKKYVEIRYHVGFERMIRAAVKNFERMGLCPVVCQGGELSYAGRNNGSTMIGTTEANRQYLYDHKADRAMYLDKPLVERRLEILRTVYEQHKEEMAKYAGPALVEVYGEKGFEPENNSAAYQYTEKQQKLNVYYASLAGQIGNQYIKGEERSFTIIAYPIPEIGGKFEEIFEKNVEINTLDYKLYQEMQQKLIDVLDQAEYVHVTGKGANQTDLMVAIHPLADPEHQTAFENCVADVNIPVGEVFTSPVLKGTNGHLHVTQVYLNGMKYLDLALDFKNGLVTGYTCKNLPTEEENRAFLKETLLKHHETLPMGEFAIGTNTTAYKMGIDYQIQDKLPILIAEKTGPHFAVGDTCYSWAEDTPVYNPDGKEIIARDNAISGLRKLNPQKAYFNCHTDITIPYDELDQITVIRKDGTTVDVIRDGRFVVPGTELLNKPLDE